MQQALTYDDDGGGSLNARIRFRPFAEGTYRIIATTFKKEETGSYTLRIGAKVPDRDKLAAQLEKVAKAFVQSGHPIESLSYWTKALEQYASIEKEGTTPQSKRNLTNAHNERGNIYFNHKKEYDKAIADYSEAIRLEPKHAIYYSNRGNTYLSEKQYDKAMADFNMAVGLNPNDAYVFNRRGLGWERQKDFDKAIADYSEAIRLSPKNATYYRIRGGVYNLDLKDYDKAIADYSEAIRLDPKYVDALNDRGICWLRKGERDKAISDLTDALQINPKFKFALANRGDAWRDKGIYAKALTDYEEALRVDPNYAYVFNARGMLRERQRDYTKAIADYSEAIRIDSQNASYYSNRAGVYSTLKEFQKALADDDEAVRLNPNPSNYLNRGLDHFDLKDYDKAIVDYTEAIRLDPKYALAYNQRGRAWNLQKDHEKAIADFSETIRLNPKHVGAYSNRGDTHAQLRQWDKASLDFSKALDLRPADLSTSVKVAVVRLELGDVDGYRQVCEALLERFRHTKTAADANDVAWAGVLAPKAVADPAALVPLAELGVAADPKNYDRLNTLGAALYRAGKFELAVQRLNEAIKGRDNEGIAQDWLFLAMAYKSLNQPAEARKWLDKASRWLDQAEKGTPKGVFSPLSWNTRLELQLLRREAEALVNEPPAEPKKDTPPPQAPQK